MKDRELNLRCSPRFTPNDYQSSFHQTHLGVVVVIRLIAIVQLNKPIFTFVLDKPVDSTGSSFLNCITRMSILRRYRIAFQRVKFKVWWS